MTNHKRGNTHWTADYKKCKEERDALIAEMVKLNEAPKMVYEPNNKHAELLREIYSMLNQYYCDTQQIKYKIEQSGVIDE